MKRIFALIISAVMLLAGCSSGKPLTPEEYSAALKNDTREWSKDLMAVASLIPDDAEDGFLDTIKGNKSEAEKYFGELEKDFAAFESIVPPEDYAELHEKLLVGVKHERTWLKYVREMFSADNADDYKNTADALEKHVDSITENNEALSQAYYEIYLKFKEDGVE